MNIRVASAAAVPVIVFLVHVFFPIVANSDKGQLILTRVFGTITSSEDANTAVFHATAWPANQDYEYAALLADMDCVPTAQMDYGTTRPMCVATHLHSNILPIAKAGTFEQRAVMAETRNYSNNDVQKGRGIVQLTETFPGSTGRYINAEAITGYVSARGGRIEEARVIVAGGQVWSSVGSYTGFDAEPIVTAGAVDNGAVGFKASLCKEWKLPSPCTAADFSAGAVKLSDTITVRIGGVERRVKLGDCTVSGVTKQCLYVD